MNKNTQLTHDDHRPSGKKFPLCILADDINNPSNIGSLFRLCDALGIERLYLCGNSATPPNNKINRSSRSTEKHVASEYFSDASELAEKLKTDGYYIIALEITSSSLEISSPEFEQAVTGRNNTCLILGSENTGIDEKLLLMCDLAIHIPMHGINSSMNVISAASIACYELTRRLTSF